MIDDQELRDVLEVRASRAVGLDLGAIARTIAGDPSNRARPFVGRSVALGLAAVVAAIASLAGLAVVLGQPDGSPAPTSAGPSVRPTTTVEVPPGVEAWPALTWSAVDAGPFELADASNVRSVVPWKGGFAAAGSSYDDEAERHTAQIWTTTDGRNWDLVAELPDRSVAWLVPWAGDLVLVGNYPTPGMWRSADAVTWAEVDVPDDWMDVWQPVDLVVGPDAWLVMGVVTFDGPSIWFQGNPGGDWALVTPEELTVDAGGYAIAVGDDLWIAAGAAGAITNEPRSSQEPPIFDHGAFWWSLDGREWTAASVDRPGGYVSRVLRVAEGWVAIGGDERCSGCDYFSLAWWSADGKSWEQVDLGIPEPNVFQGLHLCGDGQRGLMLDTVDGQLRIRETFNGLAWREIPMQFEAPFRLEDVVGFDSPVVGPAALLAYDRRVQYVAVPGRLPP